MFSYFCARWKTINFWKKKTKIKQTQLNFIQCACYVRYSLQIQKKNQRCVMCNSVAFTSLYMSHIYYDAHMAWLSVFFYLHFPFLSPFPFLAFVFYSVTFTLICAIGNYLISSLSNALWLLQFGFHTCHSSILLPLLILTTTTNYQKKKKIEKNQIEKKNHPPSQQQPKTQTKNRAFRSQAVRWHAQQTTNRRWC